MVLDLVFLLNKPSPCESTALLFVWLVLWLLALGGTFSEPTGASLIVPLNALSSTKVLGVAPSLRRLREDLTVPLPSSFGSASSY
jgi:hypothetical protein